MKRKKPVKRDEFKRHILSEMDEADANGWVGRRDALEFCYMFYLAFIKRQRRKKKR